MEEKTKPGVLNYVLPVILLMAGALHFVRHGLDALAVIPVVFGSFGLYMALFNHVLFKRVERLVIKLWYPIGQLITVLLLTITFYVVFAPVGLFLRLIKKDILNKKFKTDHLSYWLGRSKQEQDNYTQQF